MAITIMVWWTEGFGKGEFHHCSLWCSGVEKRIPITKSLWEKGYHSTTSQNQMNQWKHCNTKGWDTIVQEEQLGDMEMKVQQQTSQKPVQNKRYT